jgi:hypothetical protein
MDAVLETLKTWQPLFLLCLAALGCGQNVASDAPVHCDAGTRRVDGVCIVEEQPPDPSACGAGTRFNGVVCVPNDSLAHLWHRHALARAVLCA